MDDVSAIGFDAGHGPSTIRGYTLFKEDIERLREAGGPMADLPDLAGVRENMAVAVVEVNGTIVAYWPLFMAMHAEPLWITPTQRHNPGVIRAMVEAMLTEARQHDEPAVYCSILAPQVEAYAARLGFVQLPGTMWEKPLKEG